METIKILGVRIQKIHKTEALKTIITNLEKGTPMTVFTPGPEFLVRAHKDERFCSILNDADLLLPDGTGVILASFGKIRERVTGADIVMALLEKFEHTERKIGIIIPQNGLSSSSVLRKKLQEQYPELKVYIYLEKSQNTPDDAPSQEVLQRIKNDRPDIVFVALGSPFQEYWITHVKNILKNTKVFMGVGGVFDYVTGAMPRAPQWIRNMGLEWLFRLMQQPKRLKRMINAIIVFPFLVFREKCSNFKKQKISRTQKLLMAGILSMSVFIPAQEKLSAFDIQTEEDVNSNTPKTPVQGELPAQSENDGIEEDEVLQDLNTSLDEKAQEIEDIEKKIDQLNKTIEIKQQEQLTLKSQLEIIDASIEKTAKEIEVKEKEIELLGLEIEKLQNKIHQKEQEIVLQKKYLAETLQTLYIKEDKTYLEILVIHDSFSDFFAEITYLEELEKQSKAVLGNIKDIKQELELEKTSLERKKESVIEIKNSLAVTHEELQGEKKVKEDILAQSAQDEEKFQGLVEEVRREQTSLDSEMRAIERQVRERLAEIEEAKRNNANKNEEGSEDPLLEDDSDFGGPLALSWPIASREITCGFDCGDYPFRRYFKHSGVDIATPQGTKIGAAASGYVAIAKDGGATGYSYIMLVHGTGYATVYGHLGVIEPSMYEKLETGRLVRKGEIIGRSGGAPGTPGAGRFSTGPHLHFELRENGIPIDPLPFLP